MKWIIGGIAVTTVIIYFVYPIRRAISVSKSIEEHTVAYEQHPEALNMRILVGGDSTGVGTGASDPQDSIAGRVGKDFPNADIENISENGITLEQLRKKLYALPDRRYDLIVVQIGANDVTGFTSEKKVSDELSSVLDYTDAHASSTVVLTAGDIGRSPVFKWPLSALITHRTLMIRNIFQDEISSRPSVTYVDLFKSSVDDIFNSDIKKYYAADHFHPSSQGYGVWYKEVQPALKKIPTTYFAIKEKDPALPAS